MTSRFSITSTFKVLILSLMSLFFTANGFAAEATSAGNAQSCQALFDSCQTASTSPAGAENVYCQKICSQCAECQDKSQACMNSLKNCSKGCVDGYNPKKVNCEVIKQNCLNNQLCVH